LPKLFLILVNFQFFLYLPIDVFKSAHFIKILLWIHAKVSITLALNYVNQLQNSVLTENMQISWKSTRSWIR